jgi:hypothetical protein
MPLILEMKDLIILNIEEKQDLTRDVIDAGNEKIVNSEHREKLDLTKDVNDDEIE